MECHFRMKTRRLFFVGKIFCFCFDFIIHCNLQNWIFLSDFYDILDVAMNLSIAVTFYGVSQFYKPSFDLSTEKKHFKKFRMRFIKIWEFSEASYKILAPCTYFKVSACDISEI